MREGWIVLDEDLTRRLPLPLAGLFRRAHNARTALERHQAAYYLWEASLKLLASVLVIRYAEQDVHRPEVVKRLQNLVRPSLGHWWEFVRLLLPALAATDAGIGRLRELFLGHSRGDLPRVAALNAALAEALEGHAAAHGTVRLDQLFERLVRYRNREVGHGAAGQRSGHFYETNGRALLEAAAEFLARCDLLAGRRLIFVAEVRGQPSGDWLLDRYELVGEVPRRLEASNVAAADIEHLPRVKGLYLEQVPGTEAESPAQSAALHCLAPLIRFEDETGEVFFLSSRRGRRRADYLCYHSGRVIDVEDLGPEQRALLARIMKCPVTDDAVTQWYARSQAEDEPAQPASAPRSLGEFEVVSELGRGGMGVVYRAWQPSLGRQVALKCLLRSGDAKSEARFGREIRAHGRVEHPHLVKVFTSGCAGEQLYYAMELLDGASLAAVSDKLQERSTSPERVDINTWQETLSTACAETRQAEKPFGGASALPQAAPAALTVASYVEHTVTLIEQVAEAAHALHQAGIIHRDIKPGNILVSPDGQAVLLDLGLAQLADEMEGKLTRTRQFVGTLRYASPEQVLAVGRLDCRSDVYSLGATLWELLTLRPLFGATDKTPTPELMKRIQFAEPERIRAHHPSIAGDLEAIVMKCLEKDPERRYASAQELAGDLRRWRRGEPVHAQKLTWRYRARKFIRRKRVALGLIAALLLAQVVLGWGLLHFFAASADESPSNHGELPPQPGKKARPAPAADADNYALLVGCTRYDNLHVRHHLEGPANDVMLVRKTLCESYGFAGNNIVVLAEEDARAYSDEELRPTRNNILRELKHLARLAGPGKRVVVLLSGHGSEQPEPETLTDARQSSLTGVSPVFLPADTRVWDAATKSAPNAIFFGELGAWTDDVANKGTEVWLIADFCHSGSLLRSDEISRKLDTAQDLKIPPHAVKAARDRATQRALAPGPVAKNAAGKVIVMHASQAGEDAVEGRFPRGAADARYHGLFTFTLCQLLGEPRPRPLTYQELSQRVRDRYIGSGRTFPTPILEGSGLALHVLGGKTMPARVPLLRAVEGKKWTVDAGAFHGLTENSILAVYPPHPTGHTSPPHGHVRVTEVHAFAAQVQPCAYARLPESRALPNGGRCQQVYIDYGPMRLKVAASLWDRQGNNVSESDRQLLDKELQQLLAGDLPLELVASPANADWLVIRDKDVYLVPAEGLLDAVKGPMRMRSVRTQFFGPYPAGEEMIPKLHDSFAQIIRGRNLLALADKSGTELGRSIDSTNIRVDVLKVPRGTDASSLDLKKLRSAARDGNALAFKNGDRVAIVLENTGKARVSVTLLFVDSGFGIFALSPRPGDEAEVLDPGASRTFQFKVTDQSIGLESVVAIATAVQEPPVDFRLLEQPTLAKARSDPRARAALKTDLGRLLLHACYGDKSSAGFELPVIDNHVLQMRSWRVEP